jgi:hypothetical protein
VTNAAKFRQRGAGTHESERPPEQLLQHRHRVLLDLGHVSERFTFAERLEEVDSLDVRATARGCHLQLDAIEPGLLYRAGTTANREARVVLTTTASLGMDMFSSSFGVTSLSCRRPPECSRR